MQNVVAVKPVFDRPTQTFSLEVIRDADVLLAHNGYFVYNDPEKALAGLKSGVFVPKWTERKRAAVVEFLQEEIEETNRALAELHAPVLGGGD